MTSLEQARKAKAILAKRLGAHPWLMGIGVASGGSGFCIQVNVDSGAGEPVGAVPEHIDGVPVRIERVGKLTPLRR